MTFRLSSFDQDPMTATGSFSGSFVGDGSALINVTASASPTASYVAGADVDGTVTSAETASYGTDGFKVDGNLNLAGHLLPTQPNLYNLGQANVGFASLYMHSASNIYAGDTTGTSMVASDGSATYLGARGTALVIQGNIVSHYPATNNFTKLGLDVLRWSKAYTQDLDVSGSSLFEGNVSGSTADFSGDVTASAFAGDGANITGLISASHALKADDVTGTVTSAETASYGNNNFIVGSDPGGTELLRVSGSIRASDIIAFPDVVGNKILLRDTGSGIGISSGDLPIWTDQTYNWFTWRSGGKSGPIAMKLIADGRLYIDKVIELTAAAGVTVPNDLIIGDDPGGTDKLRVSGSTFMLGTGNVLQTKDSTNNRIINLDPGNADINCDAGLILNRFVNQNVIIGSDSTAQLVVTNKLTGSVAEFSGDVTAAAKLTVGTVDTDYLRMAVAGMLQFRDADSFIRESGGLVVEAGLSRTLKLNPSGNDVTIGGDVSASGDVTASAFKGDGAQVTGVVSASHALVADDIAGSVTTAETASYVQGSNVDGAVALAASASHALQADSARTANTATSASHALVSDTTLGTITNAETASFGSTPFRIGGDQGEISSHVTFSAAWAAGPAIVLDSPDHVGIFLDRGAISSTAQLRLRTTGSNNWRFGLTGTDEDLTYEHWTGTGWSAKITITPAGALTASAFAGDGAQVTGVVSASHALNADSTLTANTASYVAAANVDGTVASASYALNADSASLATTASYISSSGLPAEVAYTNVANVFTALQHIELSTAGATALSLDTPDANAGSGQLRDSGKLRLVGKYWDGLSSSDENYLAHVNITATTPTSQLEILAPGAPSALILDRSGVITNAEQPGFVVNRSGSIDQTITNSTWTTIQFDNEEFDRGGVWDSTTNYRLDITAATAGLWYVYFQLTMQPGASTYSAQYRIRKNGATLRIGQHDFVTGGWHSQMIGTLVELADTDTIDFQVWQNSGGSQVLEGTNTWTFGGGVKLW